MRIDFVNSSGSKVTVRVLVHLIVSDFSFTHALRRQMAGQRRQSSFTAVFPFDSTHVMSSFTVMYTSRSTFINSKQCFLFVCLLSLFLYS